MTFAITRRSMLAVAAAGPFAMSGTAAAAAPKGSAIYPIAIPTYQQIFVAKEKGFFKDEGYDFRLINGGGGEEAQQILAAGGADFVLEDVEHCLQLINHGRPARALMFTDTRQPGQYYVIRTSLYKNGITTLDKIANWKRPDGAKPVFGVSSLGGTIYVWANLFMQHFGYSHKVLWIGVGGVKTMLGALKTNQIDVLITNAAIATEAEKQGWGRQIFCGSSKQEWDKVIGGDVPINAHMALLDTVKHDPAKVQAYINAVYRAGLWIEKASASEIYDTIRRYLGNANREANVIGINELKSMANYSGMTDAASWKRGGQAWYRPQTGIKPVPLTEAFDPRFILAARKKYAGA